MKFYLFSWHGIVHGLPYSEEEVRKYIEDGLLEKTKSLNWHFVTERDLCSTCGEVHQIKTLKDLNNIKKEK